MPLDVYFQWCDKWFSAAYRVLRAGGSLYVSQSGISKATAAEERSEQTGEGGLNLLFLFQFTFLL